MLDDDDAAQAVDLIRKVWPMIEFTAEQLATFEHVAVKASTYDVCVEAVELMAQEGVRFPIAFDLRERIDRIHERIARDGAPALPGIPACCPGGFDFIGFKHQWEHHFNEDTRERVRRIAPHYTQFGRWLREIEPETEATTWAKS